MFERARRTAGCLATVLIAGGLSVTAPGIARASTCDLPTGVIPNPTNTASYADGALPVYSGTNGAPDLVISASNTVIQNLEIRGFVKFSGSPTNVTIKNVRIVGRDAGYVQSALIDTSNAGAGLTIKNSELTGWANGSDNTRYWLNGIGGTGSGWTAYANNIHDVVDALRPVGDNILIRDNYLHGLTLRTDDADHQTDLWPGKDWWTHNDIIQFTRGVDVTIDCNTISAGLSQNTGMIGDPNAKSIDSKNVKTSGNHGSIAKNADYFPNAHGILLQAKSGHLTNITINNNWFSHATYLVQADGRAPYDTGNSSSWSGNVWYPEDQTVYKDGPGLATQGAFTSTWGTFTGLLNTTTYAANDLNIPAGWRGHVVQPPAGGGPGGSYKFNPALTP